MTSSVTSSCGDPKLSIVEFAVLLQSISRSAPTYNIIFKNCYWYAGAIYNCVLKQYESSFQPKDGRTDKKSKIYRLPTGVKLGLRAAPLNILWENWCAEMHLLSTT